MPHPTIVIVPSFVRSLAVVNIDAHPEYRGYVEEGEKLALVPHHEVEAFTTLLRAVGAKVRTYKFTDAV